MFGRLLKSVSVVAFVAFFLVLASFSCVHATENGGSIYPGGNEDFMAGALPPPGFYFLYYFLWYHADTYEDLRLPPGAGPDGSLGGAKVRDVFGEAPDFRADVVANVLRPIYVTPIKIFGADWAVHLIMPILYADVEVGLPAGMGHLSGSTAAIGDITIDPFILGWHWKNWHITTGVDISIPTGDYDAVEVANVGRNYWEFEPIFAFTYLSDKGFETSLKLMYDFNTENPDTDYTSGQEFHFDYLVGQHIRNWMFGVNGSFYTQTTNDEFDGQPDSFDGNRGQAFGIGPAVMYQYKNMFFGLKYQFETLVTNRPEGEKLWLRFIYAF